jgi:inorganic triphosphatase YgiF
MTARPPAPHEIELRLEVAPPDLDRLQAVPLLALATATRRSVHSVYWDTSGLHLHRAGISLRVREDDSRNVQTAETFGSGVAGLTDCIEVESTLSAGVPDIDRVTDTGLREAILSQTVLAGRALEPVLETEVERTTRCLEVEGASVELAIDVGEIRLRDGVLPVCELELGLLSGSDLALFDLALALNEHVPLRPFPAGKPERGFARLTGDARSPRRAQELVLPAEATLDSVLVAVTDDCLAQIVESRDAALRGDDAEGVHQMRVGARRLRSALGLLKGVLPHEPVDRLRQQLRWLGSELGRARDLDVLLAERLDPPMRQRPDDGALKQLRDEASAARDAAYERVRWVLRSADYARLVLGLGRFLAARAWRDQPLTPRSARIFAPAAEVARSVLEKRHRRARQLGREIDRLGIAELHELRIELKKLRYASETFGTLFERKPVGRTVRRLSSLQTVLGHLNDEVVAQQLLDELLERMGSEASAAHQRAAGFVLGWSAHERTVALEDLERRWDRFVRTKRFWH